MAQISRDGAAAYFPPLEVLLSGGQKLISWQLAYATLLRLDFSQPAPQQLQDFIADPGTLQALTYDAFPSKPSPQSKGDFETRTAAIHVTPANDGQYNISEIKEDALWLSKETGINEIEALRLTVLDWQQESASMLLEGYTEEEVFSLQSVMGNWHDAIGGSQGSIKELHSIESQSSRRIRLLRLSLQEQDALSNLSMALAAYCPSQDSEESAENEKASHWTEDIAEKLKQKRFQSFPQAESPKSQLLVERLKHLGKVLDSLSEGSGWDLAMEDPSLDQAFGICRLNKALLLLKSIYVTLITDSTLVSAEAVGSWFSFIGQRDFLEGFTTEEAMSQSTVTQIRTLTGLISLDVLRLSEVARMLSSGNTTTHLYFLDAECTERISDTLYAAAARATPLMAPAMLAWAIILHALRSAGPLSPRMSIGINTSAAVSQRAIHAAEQSPAIIQSILEKVEQYDMDVDYVKFLSRAALDVDGFFPFISQAADDLQTLLDFPGTVVPEVHARHSLLNVLDASCHVIGSHGYNDATVGAFLSAVGSSETRTTDLRRQMKSGVIQHVFRCEMLGDFFLGEAVRRYPQELEPFLRICRALSLPDQQGNPIERILGRMPTIMLLLPQDFSRYRLLQEEDVYNRLALTEDLPIFSKGRGGRSFFTSSSASKELILAKADSFTLPQGTEGAVLNDSRPILCAFDFPHPAFSFLAVALATAPLSSDRRSPLGLSVSGSEQAQIIALLTSQMQHFLQRPGNDGDGVASARGILEQASDFLDDENDIITIVLDIFEQHLSSFGQNKDDDARYLLVQCVSFFRTILKVIPSRIWPMLARSSLLDLEGQSGLLQSVVTSYEIVTGSYAFLLECARFYHDLLAEATSHSISRHHPRKRQKHRYTSNAPDLLIPDKIVNKVMLAYTKVLFDASQTTPDWGFSEQEQRYELNTVIWQSFETLVRTTSGLGSPHSASENVLSFLSSSANYILDSLVTGESPVPSLRPQILAVTEGLNLAGVVSNPSHRRLLISQSHSALSLITTVLDLGKQDGRQLTHLEKQLLSSTPALVRLYAATNSLKPAVLTLITSLVTNLALRSQDPPSLFGSLGQATMDKFVKLLADMSDQLDGFKLQVAAWKFMSAVMGNRQQWLATFLLTGKAPRQNLLKKAKHPSISKPSASKSMLDLAMDELNASKLAASRLNLVKLEFVVTAQASWPWVSTRIKLNTRFLDSAAEALGKIESVPANSSSGENAVRLAFTFQCNAHVAELLSVLSHNLRQLGDDHVTSLVIPKLGVPGQMGFFTPSYNSSLHSNLNRNFEAKFPGQKLAAFKYRFPRVEYGNNFYYDISFARQVLAPSSAWGSEGESSFIREMERANENLSLVESQISAFNGWKLLTIQFGMQRQNVKEVQDALSYIVFDCLRQAGQRHESMVVLERLAQSRADLAVVLLQQLLSANSHTAITSQLLAPAYEAVRLSCQDCELLSASPELEYQRTLLRLLYLALRSHATSRSQASQTNEEHNSGTQQKEMLIEAEIMINICTEVVAKGVRSIAAQLHDTFTVTGPADLACLNAMLQCIVSTPKYYSAHPQVAVALANSGASRVVLALFSWCDSLTSQEDHSGGPNLGFVSADLCISLLSSMSVLPSVAEFLATEGALSQIEGASIMRHFRRPQGIGQLDQTDPLQTLYPVWSRGILPLILNIFVAVGDSFAPEVVAFLNAFPEQLQRANGSLEAKVTAGAADPFEGCITLPQACEAHALALIKVALDRARDTPGALAAGTDLPELEWDHTGVREDAENWLQGSRVGLQERLLPTNDREAVLLREDKLEGLVKEELQGIIQCLGGVFDT